MGNCNRKKPATSASSPHRVAPAGCPPKKLESAPDRISAQHVMSEDIGLTLPGPSSGHAIDALAT